MRRVGAGFTGSHSPTFHALPRPFPPPTRRGAPDGRAVVGVEATVAHELRIGGAEGAGGHGAAGVQRIVLGGWDGVTFMVI